jgi:SAM-dependent methyltransferase
VGLTKPDTRYFSVAKMRDTPAYWTRSYFRRKKWKEKSWRVGVQPEKIFLREVRKSLEKKMTLLDIGCGDGFTVKSIAGKVREAYGVDTAPRLVEIAEKGAPSTSTSGLRMGVGCPFRVSILTVSYVSGAQQPRTSSLRKRWPAY